MREFIKANKTIFLLVVLFISLAILTLSITLTPNINSEYDSDDYYVLIYKHRLFADNYVWLVNVNDVFVDKPNVLYIADNDYVNDVERIYYLSTNPRSPLEIGVKKNAPIFRSDYSGYYVRVSDLLFPLEEGLVFRKVV